MKGKRPKIRGGVEAVWQYSRQLFSVSGVNGVSHIAVAKSGGRRLLWTVIFSVSLVGWFYQTTTLLEHYYTYPTVVKIQVEKEPVMDFPGMTVCNINRIRKSQYCSEFPCASNDSIQLSDEQVFNLTFEFMKRGRKSLLGHQIEDMIVDCTFSGKPKLDTTTCLRYFSPVYDTHLGNCFVFSSDDRESLTVTEPDAWQDIKDLELVLNVERDEYLDVEEAPGLVVAVHEDMAYPHLSSHAIHVQVGKTYHLAVEKVTVYLLSSPYKTNCTDYRHLPFENLTGLEPTPMMCTVQCLLHHQQKKCGHGYVTDNVILFMNKMPYDPAQVTEEDKRCANQVSAGFKHYCSSLCGVPCHDVHFAVSIDSSPTGHHHDPEHDPAFEEYRKRTRSDKRMDLVHVKIHFQTMEHRIYRHSPEYTTEILFSYLGGITGGWLGISLLEFCAFVEGLLSVFLFSFRYCKPSTSRKRRAGGKRKAPSSRQCDCQCSRDYGSMLLAMPDSPKTVRVVPFGYYY